MKTIIIKTTLLNILLMCVIHGSAQVAAVHITVHVPGPIAVDKGPYITGSFNSWHPGDSLYRMNKVAEGLYSITLPLFDSKHYEYKYTLGNWDRVEVAFNDSSTSNRVLFSANEKNITDTVMKWKQSQQVPGKINPQLQKINAMKDSMMAGAKPELKELQKLLGSYVNNFLQEKPSTRLHKQLDRKTEIKINHLYEQITKLLWDIMACLSPEQKQAIQYRLNQSTAGDDFLKTFPEAFNAVLQGKK